MARFGRLGSLERDVMESLWAANHPQSAYDLASGLTTSDGRAPAPTTVLTVLGRLERKGFVVSDRSARPHRYRPSASRAEHMADLMHQVLVASDDRRAVLERFVGGVSADDAELLRGLLTAAGD